MLGFRERIHDQIILIMRPFFIALRVVGKSLAHQVLIWIKSTKPERCQDNLMEIRNSRGQYDA